MVAREWGETRVVYKVCPKNKKGELQVASPGLCTQQLGNTDMYQFRGCLDEAIDNL